MTKKISKRQENLLKMIDKTKDDKDYQKIWERKLEHLKNKELIEEVNNFIESIIAEAICHNDEGVQVDCNLCFNNEGEEVECELMEEFSKQTRPVLDECMNDDGDIVDFENCVNEDVEVVEFQLVKSSKQTRPVLDECRNDKGEIVDCENCVDEEGDVVECEF